MLAMFGWKPSPPSPPPSARPRRGDGIFQRIENQHEIGTVLCRHYRSRDGTVRFRANRFLDPQLVALVKMDFRKPLLSSWSAFLPEAALSDPDAFSILSSRILITSNSRETPNDFWDGAGNYQDYIKHRDIPAFSGSTRIAAFAVLLAELVYVEVRTYLEIPPEQ